ncbi:MAG: hypothetical protein JXR96_15055 [Deltaproteobacteria bacterium]|nr:hypothetical protein [Deltaproteobacteria bacterium]
MRRAGAISWIAVAVWCFGCHPADSGGSDAAVEDASRTDRYYADLGPGECDGLEDTNAFEIQRGESSFCRYLDRFESFEFQDGDYTRTVIRLAELVDAEVAEVPEDFRYMIYGTDGYTFGGYATWDNIQNGYIELGTRRVVWEPSQELPHSFRVKDAYLMVCTPAGG